MESTTVTRIADLSVTKSDNPDPVIAGEDLTYTVTVTNGGPSDATNVVFTDNLPTGTSFTSASASQGTACTEDNNVVTCNLGSLADGATATVTIVVTVAPETQGNITNTASAAGDETDPNAADSTNVTQSTAVQAQADLSVTKSDNPDPVRPSDGLVYTVAVTNNGPSNATVVILTDIPPSTGITFLSAASTAGSCTEAAGTVTCDIGSIANGATATATIQVTVNQDVSAGTTLTNNASVTGNEEDPNSSDDNAATETTVVTDLAIAKADDPDPATAGANLTYTLTVTNGAAPDATNVVVTDTLPSGVSFVSAVATQGTCAQDSGTVTCGLGTLSSGSTATVTIIVTVDQNTLGVIINNATVASDEFDPDGSNNTTTESTTVNPNAPPTASITSPADGATFSPTDSIAFSGSGDDTEDGALTGASLVWTSSLDCQIGTGMSFARSLNVGSHTIMLTATDTQAASGNSSVDVTISSIVCGDVHPAGGGDGDVDVLDALQELKISVSLVTPDDQEQIAGDVHPDNTPDPDGDSDIDVLDALRVLKASVGLVEITSCGGSA